MFQTWHDLLFAHWPIPLEALRPLVPHQLPLDTFDGKCWLGIAPFHMSGVRARGVPPLPGLSRFPEVNVRTYCTLDGKPGVFFFSLDAANRPAVWAARSFYHLPYFFARMEAQVAGDDVSYFSRRLNGEAELQARYRPIAPVQLRRPGTLEHWLTERYCLYAVTDERVYRAEIHHLPWPLQDAHAEFEKNTMAAAAGLSLPPVEPLLHFAKQLQVLIWPLKKIG
ncbi:MAG: hypothetical protein DMG68_01280 [Acidobacteria bacterium]|nr:MAG: hypothetical protein DMG68_01280 [Acidobacteriota bacterium]